MPMIIYTHTCNYTSRQVTQSTDTRTSRFKKKKVSKKLSTAPPLLASFPDPITAVADGLHHRYANVECNCANKCLNRYAEALAITSIHL